MATKNRLGAVALLLASGLLFATTGGCGGDGGSLLGAQELQAPDVDADAPVSKPGTGNPSGGKTADAGRANEPNGNDKSDENDAGEVADAAHAKDGGKSSDGGGAGEGGLGQKCQHNSDCASKLCLGFKNNKICL